MMATNVVIVKDLFEEFSEENQRLFDELRYCQQLIELFDKFRQLLDNYQTNCCCIENIELKTQFNELEDQYMKTLKKKIITQSLDQQLISKSDNKIIAKKKNTRIKKIRSRNNTTNSIEHKVKTSPTGDQLSDSDIHNDIIDDNCNHDINDTKLTAVSDSQLTAQRIKRRYTKRKRTPSGQLIQEKQFQCDWIGCGKACRDRIELVAHIRLKHTKERPYGCSDCGKCFPVEKYLKTHRKHFHPNSNNMSIVSATDKTNSTTTAVIKVYKCQYDNCPTEFRKIKSLKEHHKRHENRLADKSYLCDVDDCGKRFVTIYTLNRHKLSFHSDDRPYPCDWPGCDKRFKDAHYMKSHKERHTGLRQYRCNEQGCDKSYTTYRGLFQHRCAHTRPYMCPWPACDTRYSCKEKLDEHMNTHQGLKPFGCHFDGCSASYASKSSLRCHWRQTHKYIKSFHDK